MATRERIRWIDIAKGICMIAVALGHLGNAQIIRVVYIFNLTVFFILSGYTLKRQPVDSAWLSKKFTALMAPYFMTCLAVLCMDVFNSLILYSRRSVADVTLVVANDLVRFFWAAGSRPVVLGPVEVSVRIGAIWFLPALFFSLIATQLLLNLVEQPGKRLAVGTGISFASYMLAQFVCLPFSILPGLFALPFVLVGYELRERGILERLQRGHAWWLFALAFLLGVWKNIGQVYFVTATTANYVVSLPISLCSSLLVILIAMRIGRFAPLEWIGRFSIYCLCIHLFELETMGGWFARLRAILGIASDDIAVKFVQLMIFIILGTLLLTAFRRPTAKQKALGLAVPKNDGVRPSVLPVDVAKGVLIILILVAQYAIAPELAAIICSLVFEAFVFFSGYGYGASDTGGRTACVRSALRELLVPYMAFAVMAVAVKGISLGDALLGASLSGSPLTPFGQVGLVSFILVLFLVRILYLAVDSLAPSEPVKAVLLVAFSLVGMALGIRGQYLPWSADCALFSIPFFWLGHRFAQGCLLEGASKRPYLYFALASGWAFMIYRGGMNLLERQYGDYGIALIGALCGTIVLYMACAWITDALPRAARLLAGLGRSAACALVLYALFGPAIQDVVAMRFSELGIFHLLLSVLIQALFGLAVGEALRWLETVLSHGWAATE